MMENNREVIVDTPVELESQFILRLPPAIAAQVKAALQSGGTNFEKRLKIKIESDGRHGIVQFDNSLFRAELKDLPTIIESCKTLDRKIFYKTADICQIMIAQEGDAAKSDEEISPKKKNEDAKDKRYNHPHGITAPLKNVRKRRFRKTLKKKNVDTPDIMKEVKRLLRTDQEAIDVRYEVVNADDEKPEIKNEGQFGVEELSLEERELSNSQTADVAEYDIFGGVLSSSEESAEEDVNVVDTSERQAALNLESLIEVHEDIQEEEDMQDKTLVELSESMKLSPEIADQFQDPEETDSIAFSQLESATAGENLGQMLKEQKTEDEKKALMLKLGELERVIANLQENRRAQQVEITRIENEALKQRLQANIDKLMQEESEIQQEYDDIVVILQES